MKLEVYVGGFIGLFKDFFRFIIFGLKNPHYVAVLLAVFVGVFYINGIPPHEISVFLSDKWNAFVENRAKTFKEDYQLLSRRFFKKEPAFSDPEEDEIKAKKQRQKQLLKQKKERVEQQVLEMREEVFGWQQALESAKNQEKKAKRVKEKRTERQVREIQEETVAWQQVAETKKSPEKSSGENMIKGFLTVVSADRVKIGERMFSLNVRIHSGKAGEAYQELKRRFDGSEARCIPNNDNPEKAECFVGSLGLSEMLVDFALADPV